MNHYQTITTAKLQFKTANRPILAMCDDPEFALWVVKPSNGKHPAFGLAKELIAHRMAALWDFTQPAAALITVHYDHLKGLDVDVQRFDGICFGSQFKDNRQDWDRLLENADRNWMRKFQAHKHLLRIALFDIWLGNEDRFAGNHNLLLGYENGNYHVLPIDHEAILNATDSNNNRIYFDNEMSTIEEPYSLLKSISVIRVLKQNRQLGTLIDEVKQEFPIFVERCQVNLREAIEEIPDDWQIDKLQLYQYLNKILFEEMWKESTLAHFALLAGRLIK